MSEVTVNSRLLGLRNVNLHVDDYGGSGRPVILIHGWPLSGAAWDLQVPALSASGYRVITYDRRGFGRSDKPKNGYDYNTLADDLHGLIDELRLDDVSLIGFSMGGGEVARYIAKYGEEKLHSIVLASAVPPMMIKTDDNPDGPLDKTLAAEMNKNLTDDEEDFYDKFTTQFFSQNANGKLMVSEAQRKEALELCKQADKTAALEAMNSFGVTDFRDDLLKITIPTLVIHGDADGTVPYEGPGKRTHDAIVHSELHIIEGGPHGINVSHVDEFNDGLLNFLEK